MSWKISALVLERYPVGGTEKLLALALANCASDEGTRVFLGVKLMAKQAHCSRPTVQRLLRKMQDRGWLELVRRASGREGDTNDYRISAAWIAGGALQPLVETMSHFEAPPNDDGGVDNSPMDRADHVSSRQNHVSSDAETCLTAVRPESPVTVIEPNPLTPVDKVCGQLTRAALRPEDSYPGGEKTTLQWRWTEKRRDVERQGVKVGIGRWDEEAYARGSGERFDAYRARVQAATDARQAA